MPEPRHPAEAGARAETPAEADVRARASRRRPGTHLMILRVVVWAVGLGPLAWVGWRLGVGDLGANPIEAGLHLSGRWALVLLLLGLAVTPVRRLTGWGQVIKVRRTLGLFAFFYASLHLLVYLVLDQGLAWAFIVEDVLKRPFITVGMASFALLVPLAVTSTRGWIRRLGRRWQVLHRLVYLAAALAVLHFYWKVKADALWPLVAAGVLAVLLLARLPWRRWGRGSMNPGRPLRGESSRASGQGPRPSGQGSP